MAAMPRGSDSEASVDPQLRDYGANPAREAMRILIAIARHLAPVAGHKSLIWISGDTALIDWSSQKPGTGSYGMKNKYLDEIADKTGEALNQAHISVYPLDASAVLVGGVDASLKNRNVELSQGGAENAAMRHGGWRGGHAAQYDERARPSSHANQHVRHPGARPPHCRINWWQGRRSSQRSGPHSRHNPHRHAGHIHGQLQAGFPPDDTFHTIC